MWRLRPFTFLPASNARGPPLSVVLTEWNVNGASGQRVDSSDWLLYGPPPTLRRDRESWRFSNGTNQ